MTIEVVDAFDCATRGRNDPRINARWQVPETALMSARVSGATDLLMVAVAMLIEASDGQPSVLADEITAVHGAYERLRSRRRALR